MSDGYSAKNHLDKNSGVTGLDLNAKAKTDPRLMAAMQAYSSGQGGNLQDALKSLQAPARNYGAESAAKTALRDKNQAEAQNLMNEAAALRGGNLNPARLAQINHRIQVIQNENAAHDAEIASLNSGGAEANDATTQRAMQDEFFSNATTGSLAATEQVQGNEMLKGFYGKGGLNDRLLDEEKELSSRGFQLTQDDHEAYGQASDETARMFGQEEASLSQALAARGLAGAPSGAAAVGYSGIAGNKSERLAGAQRKIANDRMENTRQRLNSVRQQAQAGAAGANSAINDQFSRNNAGNKAYQDSLKAAAEAGQMQQTQANTEFDQIEATRGPSVGEVVGSLAGTLGGALTGGVGTVLGEGLGGALLGGGKKKKQGGGGGLGGSQQGSQAYSGE